MTKRRKPRNRNESMKGRKRDNIPRPTLLLTDMNLEGRNDFTQRVNLISPNDMKTIELDVRRSVAHWDVHRQLSESRRDLMRSSLLKMIIQLVCSIRGFRYYQGVHEVCLVVLQASGGDVSRSVRVCRQIFLRHFGDLIYRDFAHSLNPLLEFLQILTEYLDPELARVIEVSGVGYHFAVPWILTWFAHSIDRFGVLSILFTRLAKSAVDGRILIVYFCFEVIRQLRDKIFANRNDSCMIFKTLQSSHRYINWKRVIVDSKNRYDRYPPSLVLSGYPTMLKSLDTSCYVERWSPSFLLCVIICFIGLLCSLLSIY